MASQPTATRDVRPVVAAGLCLIGAILAWPMLRNRGGDAAAPAREPNGVPHRAASAASASASAPAPLAATVALDMPSTAFAARAVSSTPAARPSAAARHASGNAPAPSGVKLFPPPGTDPPKAGIVVPDDYQLPPGYVRHYQTTDDGKQLPPILMFHPDYHPVDARGRPIPLPADRIVPPDMAPPGLPHDVLQVPPTHVPSVADPPR